MSIEFLCPNGHQIRCPDEQAGRAAKCPKCGVKFRIPELAELETADADSAATSPVQSGAAPAQHEVAEGEIEFLCPNGHTLHGPASLQGRPGQCPECGSKFRIPSYDEVPDEDEETAGHEISVGRVDAGDSGLDLEEVNAGPPMATPPELVVEDVEEIPESAATVPAEGLGGMFGKLWAQRSEGATVELCLSDGQTVKPDHFAEKLSQGTHGVFGTKDPEGGYTLVAVRWESVLRVIVRGLESLPEEMTG
jgi:hypothetical protein